ncbi:MAG: TetR/AcrR family transcriptional regulator [Planctomycetes bacterium]|nr:TetR/AcrR family transcriptional regulator [Planctomycetota bacterium]
MILRNVTRSPMRERILDAADRMLARYGYQKTTADDLAREAGIGRRTVYVHFTSKEEIFLASIDRVVERLIDELKRILYSGGSAEERLRRMLEARVLYRFDSVNAYHESLDDMFAVLRGAYLDRRERYLAQEADVFAHVLTEGHRAGVLRAADANKTARTVLLATNGLLPYSLSGRELGSRAEVEEKARQLVELLMEGLRQR